MSGMTFDEALAYAKRLREDTNIMFDPKTGLYHVIRLMGVEHWSQHYETVTEVRVKLEITGQGALPPDTVQPFLIPMATGAGNRYVLIRQLSQHLADDQEALIISASAQQRSWQQAKDSHGLPTPNIHVATYRKLLELGDHKPAVVVVDLEVAPNVVESFTTAIGAIWERLGQTFAPKLIIMQPTHGRLYCAPDEGELGLPVRARDLGNFLRFAHADWRTTEVRRDIRKLDRYIPTRRKQKPASTEPQV